MQADGSTSRIFYIASCAAKPQSVDRRADEHTNNKEACNQNNLKEEANLVIVGGEIVCIGLVHFDVVGGSNRRQVEECSRS